jgi:hypothetical protein
MVVKEKDERVLIQSKFSELAQQRAQGVIEPEHIGSTVINRKAGVFESLGNGMAWRQDLGSWIQKSGGGGTRVGVPGTLRTARPMRHGGGEIEEKGLVFALFDEG